MGWIDVAFEHIEREVVEAAEGPHDENQQDGYAKRWPLEKQQSRREHTQEEEENPFPFDPGRVGQILHVGGSRQDAL